MTRFNCSNEHKKELVATEWMSDSLESQGEATVTMRVWRIKCRFPAKDAKVQIMSRMDLFTVISDIFVRTAGIDLRIRRGMGIPLP